MNKDWIEKRRRGIAIRAELMDKWKKQNAYEESLEIHQYLPIRKNKIEEEYITHLWLVFSALEDSNEFAQPFMIMPFHLLFMMALQYKVLRISKELGRDYLLSFTLRNVKKVEKLCSPSSVFDFSFLSESVLPELLKIVGCDGLLIKRIKALVEYRNKNFAHANGGISLDFNLKIMEYLECLRDVQDKFLDVNSLMADKFKSEMALDDSPNEFVETQLLGSYLCPADFKEGQLMDVFGKVGSYV